MAMAYAAAVSLLHVMDQVHLYQARQPIFLDEELIQLQSLSQLLNFLQDFLEGYSHGRSNEEMEGLESRIANAAHAAEDIIESHIVDDIHARFNGHEKNNPNNFSQALEKVIEVMGLIKRDAMETKENCTRKNQLPRYPAPVLSSRPPSRKNTKVVCDEDLNHILEKLVDNQTSCQVIPIIGMGGIGKTTLAKIAYEDALTVSHFDSRCWVTVSQEYDVHEILLRMCMHAGISPSSQESYELGRKLYQHLFGSRYLIVLDDMWSIEAWDELKSFLPDNNSGSRIVVTSRILNVADNFTSSNLYQMKLLDESKSWRLLCKKVFVEENCPSELVDVGKKIAKNCKGLPLSIGAVGGLLAKSNMVLEYWEYVAENTTTSVSSNDEENCLNILSLSYTHLPIHLKPCFLYMGVFPEDHEIYVPWLIKLWVAEGILRPNKEQTLEEVARNYLKDLIDRNLLFVTQLGSIGNVKCCKIHDLFRDMCLEEVQKEKFLHIKPVYMPKNSQGINRFFNIVKLNITDILKGTNSKRRIAIHLRSNERHTPQDLFANQPTPFLRSLIGHHFKFDFEVLVDFRLLRVFNVYDYSCSEAIFQLVNLRYLKSESMSCVLPSSIEMIWNLHTIVLRYSAVTAPVEIWNMSQLKHVIFSHLCLPDPPLVS